jgi:drug/metabolite transporter superfamily protein YnfA
MNPRVVAGVLGANTLLMGLGGLASPERTLALVGFAPLVPTAPALAYGEARAAYGGLFAVLGAFTLWGAIDAAGKRSWLLMAGCLWLGLCVGRCIGVSIDGNPGLWGWGAVVFEGAFGTALVWASLARLPQAAAAQTPSPATAPY